MSDDSNPFDDLMAQMGVRRLDAGQAPRTSGRKGAKKKKKPRHPRARPAVPPPAGPLLEAPTVEVAPVVSPVAGEAVCEDEAPTVQIRPVLSAEEQRAASQEREEVRRLRAALQHAEDNLAATRDELHRVQTHADEVDSHRRSLQRALSQLQDAEAPPALPPRLTEVLEARGLRGRDEFRFLFQAVAEARQLHGLLSWLEPSDEQAVNRFLDDRVALLGGCESCPKSPGRARVQVPRERCEVCEGSDIKRAVRRFEDACLLTGLRRVVVVGGSPKYHRQLAELVHHHRLQLDLIPGDVRRTQRQADHDLANADVIILWGATLLDHATSDLYKGKGPARVIQVPHRGIGRMLQLAGDAIDRAP